MNNNPKISLILSIITSIAQYYCYGLFTLSAITLSENFLSPDRSYDQLTKFFMVFTFSAILRPVFSLIFGFIGDKYSRTFCFKITAISCSLSCLILSFCPDYQTIGSLATSALLLSRIMLLFSVTGESDGLIIYFSEIINYKKINFGDGVVSAARQLGNLISSLAILVSSNSGYSEAWRINFFLGGILCLVSLILRYHILESPEFISHRAKVNNSKMMGKYELLTIFAKYKKWLIKSILIGGAVGGIYHFQLVFLGPYVNKIGLSLKAPKFMISCSFVLYMFSALLSGYVGDKFPRYIQIITSIVLSIILALLNMNGISGENFPFVGIILATGLIPFYSIPSQMYLREQIPVSIRYTFFSFTHSIGSLLFSTSTPLICDWLYNVTKVIWMPFVYLLLLLGVLLIINLFEMIDKNKFSDNSKIEV